MFKTLPKLSYPIQRDYPTGKGFHRAVIAGVIISLGILGVVASATQGYEPKSSLSSSYNETQQHWFNHFTSAPKPGTLCDPHLFVVGESFQTTQSYFPWSLDYVNTPSLQQDHGAESAAFNSNGISYTGLPLPSTDSGWVCDAWGMEVTVDLQAWTSIIEVNMNCPDPGPFPASATTSFTSSVVIQMASSDSNRYYASSPIPNNLEFNSFGVSELLQAAGLDLLVTMRKHINTTDAGQVVMFTAGSYPTPPLQCSSNPLDPFLNALGFDNMTTADNRAASDKFQSLFYNTTANYMHAMLAAVRLDYGNQCPNFLTDPSLINQTFLETPELTPEEYTRYYNTAESSTQSFLDILRSDNAVRSYNWGLNLPLYDVESVYITAPYLCHFTVRKGAAQFVVSIAVATFSLFLTGWGVFQCFAPRFAIHEDPVGAMYCHAHKLESGTQPITRPKDVPDNRKNRTLKSKKSKRRAWTLFLQRRRLKNVAVSSQHTLPLHATANSIPNAVTHGSNPPSQAASLRRASSRHQHSVDPASVALPESPAPSLQTGQS